MHRRFVIWLILVAAIIAAPTVYGHGIGGVYVWCNRPPTDVCYGIAAVNDSLAEIDSALVQVFTCPGDEGVVWSGYTDSTGWLAFNFDSLATWVGTSGLGLRIAKTGYNTKYAKFVLHDTLRTEIVAVELFPEPECSTYTWSAHVLDKRTGRALPGVVATVTQLQTTWWCGDTLTPWGAGLGGVWTVVSTTDGLLTTPVLRESIIRVTIVAMGYDETLVMDRDKTSGRLFLAPTGGYRR